MDLWTAGCAGSRLTAQARSPMDEPWTTLRVAQRLPTGRRLPTSSTALDSVRIKSGKVKTISPVQALAYSSPVAVQATVTTADTSRGQQGTRSRTSNFAIEHVRLLDDVGEMRHAFYQHDALSIQIDITTKLKPS